MDYQIVSEAIRGNLRDCALRGTHVPYQPNVEAVWNAVDGDGPLALLVTLEYIAARQELARTVRVRVEEERVYAA